MRQFSSETQRRRENGERTDPSTGLVIASAIEVPRELGPGLFESAYEEGRCDAARLRDIPFRGQTELPVLCKQPKLDCGYRLDLMVDDAVVVERKSVELILPVHEAPTAELPTPTKKRSGC